MNGDIASSPNTAASFGASPAAARSPVSGAEDAVINILVVDDESRNLDVLETVLDDRAYRLIRATSADEALLALVNEEFALLILDIRMPGMSGFELAKMIKQRKKNSHVPIIFLTAYYNEDQDVLEGYGSGAVDYLQKPLNAAVLRSKVAVFAELHRKSRDSELANRALLAEVAHRREIEEQLRELNETLDRRVTERTTALRENEKRLNHAANAAGLTYVEVDFSCGETRIAENFASVMGYGAPAERESDFQNFRGLFLSHVAPEDRESVEFALGEFARGAPCPKLDYRIVGDDRIERWIESEWFVEVDPGNRPLKGFFTNLEITTRKMAQEQSRKSEERFRQLADSMPQMVWTARGDGYLDYYNARWHEFTGFGPDKYGDLSNWDAILHPDDRAQCYDTWYSSVKSGETYQTEFRLWDRKSKRFCWHLGRALSVRTEDGRTVKWIGTCTDIDEQKGSEEDLRRANEALEHFAFAASHDLQEPLRNVSIYSQLFRNRYHANLDEEANMFLGFMVEGAQRAARLVSDLLAYAQITSRDDEAVKPVDTGAVFQQVLKNLDNAIRESHAVVTHEGLPVVSIKEVHLEQLLQNLIGNALKYKRDDEAPRVRVSAREQSSWWVFAVEDNGIGIAPEYHDKIFGVFKRLHSRAEKYSGTGIGLAICQRIVESYGGRIWVESEVGQGAAFHFTLPCH